VEFSIEDSDILKWARSAGEIGLETDPAIARALNAFGERVVDTAVAAIEDATGQQDVRSLITVYQADANNLAWEMDARAAAPGQSGDSGDREWRDTGDNTFATGQLLNIITCADEATCPVCEEIAANGPYTVQQINDMAMKWANYVPPDTVKGERTNLLHPNCRCAVQAWQSTRRLPVTMGPRGTPAKLMTAEQVGKAVATELTALIKAKV
jgi:hypothetical protein